MKEIQITGRLRIYEGKLNEFKTIAEACLLITREKDTGTLQYDWFLNEDQTECVVHERYKDSDAVLHHLANLGETLGALVGVSDMSAEVYGTPSAELMNAAEGMDVAFYSYYQGL